MVSEARPMIRSALVVAAIALAVLPACTGGSTPAPAPTPIVGAVVDPFKLVVSTPEDGVVRISGKPGTVSGGVSTTVTLTILRETVASPVPAFRIMHLGSGGLPIASSFAVLSPDGGFTEVPVGDPDRPVRSGDELNVTPQNGTTQSGFPVAVQVP
jgi:hypothetical protein